MREFVGKVVIEKVEDKESSYLVVAPVSYLNEKYHINVYGGWVTDGASVPKLFQNIFSSYGENTIFGAIIHDALYMSEALPRDVCDTIFLEILELKGVSLLKRRAMYRAVRIFGGFVWKKHNKNDVSKAKQFINVINKGEDNV